jgi:hypothetical protein
MKKWGVSICMLLFCLSSLTQAETSRKAIAFTEAGACDLVDLDSRTILSSFWSGKSRVLLDDALVVVDADGNGQVYAMIDARLYRISLKENTLHGELIEKEYCLRGLLYDLKREMVSSTLRLKEDPDAKLPDGPDKLRSLSGGKWLPSRIEDCVFVQAYFYGSDVANGEYGFEQMKDLFPRYADRMLANNETPWGLSGQSSRLSTFSTYRIPNGLTESEFVIHDRGKKIPYFYHFRPRVMSFTYDDLVFFEEKIEYYSGKAFSKPVYSGNDQIYFPGKSDLIPCKVEEGMRHLYVYGGKAYFKKGVDVYSVDISPFGCGAPEKVLTLPFEPERFFVFESPKPSKPGIPLPKSASEVKIQGPVFDTKDLDK